MSRSDAESCESRSYKSASTAKESDCHRCNEVAWKFKEEHRETKHVYILHLERYCIREKKTQKKAQIRGRIEKCVSALRNTKGGKLLLHVHGQKKDRYLEYLDEFIHERLEALIGDGSLYTDSYNREWLSDTRGYEHYHDVVLIHVKKANRVSTVDFNSHIRKDHENKKLTTENVSKLLQEAHSTAAETPPTTRGIKNVSLQESRHIELKSYAPRRGVQVKTADEAVRYIWSDLKLKENITSISKVEGGGSFYVGIEEEDIREEYDTCDTDQPYNRKEPKITGFLFPWDKRVFVDALINKIKQNVCLLNDQKFGESTDDLVTLELHPVLGNQPERVVLEVAIRHVDGIVFCDQAGPRTYIINKDNVIVRMEQREWLRRLIGEPSSQEE